MTPEGLHQLEYSRGILENDLGWPAIKNNQELIAECIRVVAQSRKTTLAGACDWLGAQIGKAKARGIKVTRWWLQEGEYNNLDEVEVFKAYKPIDRQQTLKEQETPEWLASSLKARQVLKDIASGKLERVNSKEKLKQQAAEILAKRSTS